MCLLLTCLEVENKSCSCWNRLCALFRLLRVHSQDSEGFNSSVMATMFLCANCLCLTYMSGELFGFLFIFLDFTVLAILNCISPTCVGYRSIQIMPLSWLESESEIVNLFKQSFDLFPNIFCAQNSLFLTRQPLRLPPYLDAVCIVIGLAEGCG